MAKREAKGEAPLQAGGRQRVSNGGSRAKSTSMRCTTPTCAGVSEAAKAAVAPEAAVDPSSASANVDGRSSPADGLGSVANSLVEPTRYLQPDAAMRVTCSAAL